MQCATNIPGPPCPVRVQHGACLSTEARSPGSRVLFVLKERWSGGGGRGLRSSLRGSLGGGGGGLRIGLGLLCLFKTIPNGT